MILNFTVKDARVVTKKVVEGKKDPSKKYYRIGVVVGNELGELQCNEESHGIVEQGDLVNLNCQYNDNFNMFSVVSVMPVEKAGKGAAK